MLNRMALRETTLSDGTVLTPGTYVSALYAAREMDPRYYDSPETFDGLRFYKLRQENGEDHRFTDVDSNLYLGFGAGKHPW
jgi:cytochrome P450